MATVRKEASIMAKPNNETRIALLEQQNGYLKETLARIQQTLDNNFYDIKEDTKNIKVELKNTLIGISNEYRDLHKDIRATLEAFNSRLWMNFYWSLGTMFSLTCGVAGLLAKGFHWFN